MASDVLAGESVVDALMSVPRLLRHPVWRAEDPTRGQGQGVLLVPGFGFGDRSLQVAATWLAARGYRPAGARIGVNIGCTSKLVDRIIRRLAAHAETTGRPVILLGQSRGGWLARLAAIERPDLVRALVTLGSPVLDPLGAHPKVVRVARFLARLSTLGLPGLLTGDCLSGSCYETNMKSLAKPLPPGMPAVAFYSRGDRIAPWRLCQDPSAECVEIHSSHTGMGFDPEFYAAVEPKLAEWALDSVPQGLLKAS
ncbi:Alpha/beta hydrolase family protein [Amycolatopsis xylanica]|uniref:Alpha/beta hydrolase family protein n=1 Tax=Amycolatopsis xylanica TaxID=589385 RepID=A0A1H3AMT5_9PSEU|nr:alpha/beta fold hydrolase [Amycolatopsis xylanica]SDX31050.1 Alpha/beta hydrolase family protein [Amycolatopsis xylanica]